MLFFSIARRVKVECPFHIKRFRGIRKIVKKAVLFIYHRLPTKKK
jgi:hypothetical protein